MKKYFCLKDCLPFLKGDVVTVYFTERGCSFHVERLVDYVFHGNENGRWSCENSAIIASKEKGFCNYMYKQQLVSKSVLDICFPEIPYDKTNKGREFSKNSYIPNRLYSGVAWFDMCLNDILSDYFKRGVLVENNKLD
jgi:hypothetical protein